MKKDLGSILALYPTPVLVIGAMVDEKPTWTLCAHMGIPSHSLIMVSLVKAHYINKGINKTKALSINIVDESWLDKADCMGCVSGNKTDKSEFFEFTKGELKTPIINEAKLSLECSVQDVYNAGVFENFMLKIEHTYADESILNDESKIDYNKFKPVLFEFPTYSYLSTGNIIGKCQEISKGKFDK